MPGDGNPKIQMAINNLPVVQKFKHTYLCNPLAKVAELVDAHDSKSCSFGSVGSSPTFGTYPLILSYEGIFYCSPLNYSGQKIKFVKYELIPRTIHGIRQNQNIFSLPFQKLFVVHILLGGFGKVLDVISNLHHQNKFCIP